MRMKLLLAAGMLVAGSVLTTPTETGARQPSQFTRCMMIADRDCKNQFPGDPAAIAQCRSWAYNGECAGLDGDPRNDGQICNLEYDGSVTCTPI